VPPGAGWITYVRCHDDIGWAVTEEDAAAVGEDGFLHRRFLADFYAGEFPGSFARGARFQADPRTGEARTSGTAASLAGLEAARERGDAHAEELAVRRILLLHALALAHGGLPLIYMGDELGLLNAADWAADPLRRDDNRWMHRPAMDWEAAERRLDAATVEGRLWTGLRRMIGARRATRAIHAQGRSEPVWTGNDHVFGLLREHAGERLLVLASFTADPQPVDVAVAREHGLTLDPDAAEPDGRALELSAERVVLQPYQHLWVSDRLAHDRRS
jgi:amylosucrase